MKVSNPLTIIAIFAGLAETLATVALVKLPPEIQSIFVYFVMLFPATIVGLFFWVLYFKNTVLYAPSDFSNQNHYLEANLIKENINDQVGEIFKRLNTNASHLTVDEINNAKADIEESIDKATTLSLREKIQSALTESPLTTREIAQHLDIPRFQLISVLSSMHKRGDIARSQGVKEGEYAWSKNV